MTWEREKTMAKYKVSTVDYGYGPDATALLAELLNGDYHLGSWPILVKYNQNELLRVPGESFALVVILRKGREYYGYVNKYWDVSK